MRRSLILSALLVALVALVATGVVVARPQLHSRDSDTVLAAVFRQEIAGLANLEDRDSILCLRVDGDNRSWDDPSDRLLKLVANTARARKVSACTTSVSGSFESSTHKAALVLAAGPVTWLNDGEAEVAGRFSRSSTGDTRPTYRVVKEKGVWVSLGPTWKYDPL